MLKTGSMLNDRYEIVGAVGSGGMSDVYKAKCHKLNRYVAIKVLKKEFSDDKNFVAKFRAEAQSAAGLSHPNIVNIYDVGEDNGLYYIVMELVEGITLKAYIEKKGRLEIKESVSIAIQVCQGIRAAHMHHIIHRDIKPQNIIISKDGKVKVTDFGIARVSSTQTINSNTMGSVHYISPEQARGGYVDERGDIYSLGISLYEMITGKVPFDSDTPVSVALMHIQNELPSPRNVVPNLPVSVEKIIYKCTQKKAERRYTDADALIEDLRTCLVNSNVKTYDISKESDGLSENSAAATAAKKASVEVAEKQKKSGSFNFSNSNDNSKTTLWKKEDVEREQHRKKDFLEKMYEDKSKNPIIERLLTAAIVLVAITICIFLIWGIIWVKDTLTPPEIFNPSTGETSSNNIPPGVSSITMPKLIGYDSGDAIIELNKRNLKNEITYEHSSAYEKGKVIAQQYREGTLLSRNTVVALVVSLGKLEYTIQDYKNMDASVVEEAFEANKISLNRFFIYDNEVSMGCVIKTVPEEGTVVHSGDKVDIYISRGSELKNVQVPSLVNLTVDEAKALLDPKGLTINNINYVESDTVGEGKIITQSFLPNSVLLQGSSIDITVSLGRGIPLTSIVLQQNYFTRYISRDNNEFRHPPAPGVNMDITYIYGILTLELEQVDLSGATIVRNIGMYTITPSDLPFQITDIEGLEDVYDGTITVYLTIGEKRYNVGSYYVEFQ